MIRLCHQVPDSEWDICRRGEKSILVMYIQISPSNIGGGRCSGQSTLNFAILSGLFSILSCLQDKSKLLRSICNVLHRLSLLFDLGSTPPTVPSHSTLQSSRGVCSCQTMLCFLTPQRLVHLLANPSLSTDPLMPSLPSWLLFCLMTKPSNYHQLGNCPWPRKRPSWSLHISVSHSSTVWEILVAHGHQAKDNVSQFLNCGHKTWCWSTRGKQKWQG